MLFYRVSIVLCFSMMSIIFADDFAKTRVPSKTQPKFVQKPHIESVDANCKSIGFSVSEYCDVTIAIENSDGLILRHLASGYLGDNAPTPFLSGSLEQKIIWDGKNDLGEYINQNYTVRVSLGLQAKLEKTLYWSPYKRNVGGNGGAGQVILPQPEGVYVYDGGQGESLKLFDHSGKFLKMVCPLPKAALQDEKEFALITFPQDQKKLPQKYGIDQYTLFTSGLSGSDVNWPIQTVDSSASTVAIFGQYIYLINKTYNIVNRNGLLASGGLKLKQKCSVVVPEVNERGSDISPGYSVVSNDGRYLYLSGYVWANYLAKRNWHIRGGLNGVGRIDLKGDGKLETFVGSLEKDKAKGNGENEFLVCSGLATDTSGRIYIGDYGNDRIKVYDENKKLLKLIPVKKPGSIHVHPQTGKIYVFSHHIPLENQKENVPAKLYCINSFDQPNIVESYDIPDVMIPEDFDAISSYGAVDFFAEEPLIWFSTVYAYTYRAHDIEKSNISVYKISNQKLVEVLDFSKAALEKVAKIRPAHHGRQRLYFNPFNKNLYVGEHLLPSMEHSKSFADLVEINPTSEKYRIVALPFDAEDMAFDYKGLAYLRTHDTIGRFNLEGNSFREVPFDYGVEKSKVGTNTSNLVRKDIVSGITFVGVGGCMLQLGGMAISPNGNIALVAENPFLMNSSSTKDLEKFGLKTPVKPPLYKGRARGWQILVWDARGKLVSDDALPGVGITSNINIDNSMNVYAMMAASKYFGSKPYFNPTSCTLIKSKAGKTKIYGENAELPMGNETPKREPDMAEEVYVGKSWVENADWLYGGVGMDGKRIHCRCVATCQFALDFFNRSIVPEPDRFDIVMIDANGNTILRIGQYGNISDGVPMNKSGGPDNTTSIGGDEVALINPRYIATDSDRRIFVADIGNSRIVSIALTYQVEEKISFTSIK